MNNVLNTAELEADLLLAMYEDQVVNSIGKGLYEIIKTKENYVVRMNVASINCKDFNTEIFNFSYDPNSVQYRVSVKDVANNSIFIRLTNSGFTDVEKLILVSLATNESMRSRVPSQLKEKFNEFRRRESNVAS